MYGIEKNDNYLQIRFNADFNYGTIRRMMYEAAMIADFWKLNDIWMVAEHRADLQLGDLQNIIDDFCKIYPAKAREKKTAIVASPGLTSAILELLANGMNRKLPLSCKLFNSHSEALEWIGATESIEP